MKRILIIADDLTGAAEIGGIALHHGLTAEIHCGTFRKGDSNVLIIDTDTRHLPDAVAGRRIRHVLESVDPSEFDLIYKKTDSLLRGPVAAELSAAMEFLHLERALLVPQNPSRGRVIENGQYLIDGIPLGCSLVAADLEHPPTTADVSQLLDPSHQFNIQCFVPGHAVPAHGIAIGAGTSAADIGHWTTQLNPQTVPAGGADFFTSLLQSRGLSPIAPQSTKSDFKNALVIFGSASVPSRDYVRKISADGVAICAMPINLFDAMTPNHTSLSPWQEAILTQLGKAGYALLAVRHPIVPKHTKMFAGQSPTWSLRFFRFTLWRPCSSKAAPPPPRSYNAFPGQNLALNRNLPKESSPSAPSPRPHPLLILKPGTYPWPPGLLPGV